jgi:DinB superfamily
MSELNPYGKYLDGRAVSEILAASPAVLAGLLESIGPAGSVLPPAPGKWSAAEILCHLADCELVFAFRLRQTLAEDNHTVQPFDQEKWAAQYPGVAAIQALDVFSAMRVWNLQLMRNLPPQAAARVVTHPERGAMTFQTIVETMAGHDLNHIGQLQRIAAARP